MSRLDSCSQNEFEVMIFLLLSRDIYFSSQTTKLLSDVWKNNNLKEENCYFILVLRYYNQTKHIATCKMYHQQNRFYINRMINKILYNISVFTRH